MGFTPSTFFWNSEDLLRCLADHLVSGPAFSKVSSDVPRRERVDKHNLSVLCRVNRACHLVFTPLLYRHITITDQSVGDHERLAPLALVSSRAGSPSLTYARTLTIERHGLWEVLHHRAARRLIRCLSSLRSFHSVEVPLEASTVATLVSSCPHLLSVRIEFPSDIDKLTRYDSRPRGFPSEYSWSEETGDIEGLDVHLGHLTHLQELCLDHLYGDPDKWIAPIAQILSASPGLKKLQLSMSQDAITFCLLRYEADLTPFKTFLLRICTLYKATGAAPLRLRSFRCGSGVHPNFPPDSAVAFTDLFCLDDLEEVYLNTSVGIPASLPGGLYIRGTDREIPIPALLYDTPRLRRFSVSRYDTLVHRTLSSPLFDARRARRLAVMWDVLPKTTMLGPSSLVRISSSPRHHFRMFKIDFRGFAAHERAQREALLDARGILEGLIDGDDGTLEGLEVQLSLYGREMYIDLLVEMIPRLTGLTQLLVRDREGELMINFGFWMDAQERLAVAGERLRWIGTRLGFVEVIRGEKGTAPRLVNMDVMDEVDEVELFGLRKRVPGYVFADRGS